MHTSVQAGGIASARMRARVFRSRILCPFSPKYTNPRPFLRLIMQSESACTYLRPCRRARRARSSVICHLDLFARRERRRRSVVPASAVVEWSRDMAETGAGPVAILGSASTYPSASSLKLPGFAAMNVSAPLKFGMGASPRRIEDGSLIRGQGRYTDDLTPAGTLTAYVLRSTAAHARINVGDLSAARAAPGVHLVWIASDVSDLD